MADFTQNTNVKSAARKLAEPIADIDAFNAIIQSVILNNPFGCVSYMSSGASHPPVEKIREAYTARIVYQDSDAKVVGRGAETYSTIAGFNTGIAAVLANTANTTAHGGTPAHNSDGDRLLGDPQMPRPQRRVVLRELLPAAGHHLVLRGRRHPGPDRDLGRQRPGAGMRQVDTMDTELILTGAFLGTGLLAYVVIPGLLVMWDRVLDHMEESEGNKKA